jgi:hypothetical protein
MRMATFKQVRFIERLMSDRESSELYDSLEAKTIRCGLGDELGTRQASRFIEMLLDCPQKTPQEVAR